MGAIGIPAIAACGLAKRFGAVQAVAGLDIEVFPGELFGFLGPNGAGKTTTINLLTGLARPDSGTIRIAGVDCSRDPKAAQHLMGIVPDESNLWPELTGFENLCFCGALYGMRRRERETRARELLRRVGLEEAAGRLFGGYSKGMKRKLAIAAAVLHSPPILFLDEPTTGIDVPSAREIRQWLADLNASGTTIFLTTHYIEEAERLCHRIAFIAAGRVVRVDTLDGLVRDFQDQRIVELSLGLPEGSGSVPGAGSEALLDRLRDAFPGAGFEPRAAGFLRASSREPLPLGPLIRFLEEHGVAVTEARVLRPSLEEVFVRVTGAAMENPVREGDPARRKGGAA